MLEITPEKQELLKMTADLLDGVSKVSSEENRDTLRSCIGVIQRIIVGDIIQNLTISQRPLDSESQRILHENLKELYA